MRNIFLTSVAAAALLGGVTAAGAQQAAGMRGPAAEQEWSAQSVDREREPRAQRGSESRDAAPSRAQREIDRQSRTPSPRSSTTGQGSDREFDRPRSERQRGEANEANEDQRGQSADRNRDKASGDSRRDGNRDRSARDRAPDRDRKATDRRSPSERTTTGQSGEDRKADTTRRGDGRRDDNRRDAARDRDGSERSRDSADRQDSRDGRFKMSNEQRTRVSTRFSERIDRMNVRPLSRTSISVSIGATVPRSVHLHVVPQDIVSIYPQFRSHRFVVVEDEIVIVEPRGQRIVAVLPMEGRSHARSTTRETTGSAVASGTRLRLSDRDRETIRTVVMREPACRLEQRVDFFLFVPIPRTVEICELPQEIVSTVPAVSAYRYAVRGDEIVLVDPDDYRVVEVIE